MSPALDSSSTEPQTLLHMKHISHNCLKSFKGTLGEASQKRGRAHTCTTRGGINSKDRQIWKVLRTPIKRIHMLVTLGAAVTFPWTLASNARHIPGHVADTHLHCNKGGMMGHAFGSHRTACNLIPVQSVRKHREPQKSDFATPQVHTNTGGCPVFRSVSTRGFRRDTCSARTQDGPSAMRRPGR